MAVGSLKSVFNEIKGANGLFIAISGGIGSGKSAAADIVREAGYDVLQSDAIATELIAQHGEIRREIAEALGDEVLNADGTLNKAVVAGLVFGPDATHVSRLRTLNSVVHPYVVQEIAERLQRLYEAGKRCVFNETAIVFEAGLEALYDYVMVIDAPEDLRVQRLLASRSMSEADIRARMATQMSSEEKRRRADFVIDNSHGVEELRNALGKLLPILPFLPAKRGESDEEE